MIGHVTLKDGANYLAEKYCELPIKYQNGIRTGALFLIIAGVAVVCGCIEQSKVAEIGSHIPYSHEPAADYVTSFGGNISQYDQKPIEYYWAASDFDRLASQDQPGTALGKFLDAASQGGAERVANVDMDMEWDQFFIQGTALTPKK